MLARCRRYVGCQLSVKRGPVDEIDQVDAKLGRVGVDAAPGHPVRLPLDQGTVRDRLEKVDSRNERRHEGENGQDTHLRSGDCGKPIREKEGKE